MNTEQWRQVPGFRYYEVSDHGRVRSLQRQISYYWRGSLITKTLPGLLMACPKGTGGYLYVHLREEGRERTFKVHALVMLAFRGARPKGMVTRHLDGNHTNNGNYILDSLAIFD